MQELFHDMFETSWGWILVVGSNIGIRHTTMPSESPQDAIEVLSSVLRRTIERPNAFPRFHEQMDKYLRGDLSKWDIKLDLNGHPYFFLRAWQACRSIPVGETRSYGWLAREAGSPKASRAAGQAMARNPLPLVIPCHRVIGSDGTLHGFGGAGLPLKKRLLALDQVVLAKGA